MERAAGEFRAIHEAVVFSRLFQGFARPASAWQSHLSARRGAAVVSAGSTGRSGDIRRYRAVRREVDRPFPPVPAVSRWNAFTRSLPKLGSGLEPTTRNCEDNPRPPRYTPFGRSRRPRDQRRKWKHWVTSSLATVRRTAEGGWLCQSSM
jgi:hypothetical protein